MNKVVLITGASSGIGQALAREFAARGDHLALCARRLDKLAMLQQEIAQQFPRCRVHIAALDVTRHDEVAACVAAAEAQLGGLDKVIVNAGINHTGRIGQGHFAADRAVIETNLLGAMATCDAAVAVFRRRGAGHLVVISSVAAFKGLPTSGAYSASKVAIATYADSIRGEVRGTAIKVTTLYPGFIDTPINRHMRSRPFVIDVRTGGRLLADLIDRGVGSATVPRFPWSLAGLLVKIMPAAFLASMVRSIRGSDQ